MRNTQRGRGIALAPGGGGGGGGGGGREAQVTAGGERFDWLIFCLRRYYACRLPTLHILGGSVSGECK